MQLLENNHQLDSLLPHQEVKLLYEWKKRKLFFIQRQKKIFKVIKLKNNL